MENWQNKKQLSSICISRTLDCKNLIINPMVFSTNNLWRTGRIKKQLSSICISRTLDCKNLIINPMVFSTNNLWRTVRIKNS